MFTVNEAKQFGLEGMTLSDDPGQRLLDLHGDVSALRIFQEEFTCNEWRARHRADNGKPLTPDNIRSFLPVFNDETGKWDKLAVNTPSMLGYQEWLLIEQQIIEAVHLRSRFVTALIGANCVYEMGTGLSRSYLLSQVAGNLGPAIQDMNGITGSDDDAQLRDTRILPLPITHKRVSIPLAMLMESRNGNSPLDLTEARQAGISVAETIEQQALGAGSAFTVGGNPVYGIFNHPNRHTFHIGTSWNTATGAEIKTDVLNCIKKLQDPSTGRHFGPYILVVGTAYNQALNKDMYPTYQSKTVRNVILELDEITDIVVSDFVPADTFGMVETQPTNIRMVVAMAPQVLQWEKMGGLVIKLQAMARMAPQILLDYYGRCGVLHASTSLSSN